MIPSCPSPCPCPSPSLRFPTWPSPNFTIGTFSKTRRSRNCQTVFGTMNKMSKHHVQFKFKSSTICNHVESVRKIRNEIDNLNPQLLLELDRKNMGSIIHELTTSIISLKYPSKNQYVSCFKNQPGQKAPDHRRWQTRLHVGSTPKYQDHRRESDLVFPRILRRSLWKQSQNDLVVLPCGGHENLLSWTVHVRPPVVPSLQTSTSMASPYHSKITQKNYSNQNKNKKCKECVNQVRQDADWAQQKIVNPMISTPSPKKTRWSHALQSTIPTQVPDLLRETPHRQDQLYYVGGHPSSKVQERNIQIRKFRGSYTSSA